MDRLLGVASSSHTSIADSAFNLLTLIPPNTQVSDISDVSPSISNGRSKTHIDSRTIQTRLTIEVPGFETVEPWVVFTIFFFKFWTWDQIPLNNEEYSNEKTDWILVTFELRKTWNERRVISWRDMRETHGVERNRFDSREWHRTQPFLPHQEELFTTITPETMLFHDLMLCQRHKGLLLSLKKVEKRLFQLV